MGNLFTKKGQAEFEKLLNECQARMAAVDDAMMFLADFLTTKKDITEVITRRSKCREEPSNATGNIQSMESDMEREYMADIFSVLTRMEETTQTYKKITIESVRNLLHFISQNAKLIEKDTGMKPLRIDIYNGPSVEDPCCKHKRLQELEEAVKIYDRLERRVAHLRQDLSSTKNKLATTLEDNRLLMCQLEDVKKVAELHKERPKRDTNQLKQNEQYTKEIHLQQNEFKTQVQDEDVKELEQVNTELFNDPYKLKPRLEQTEDELHKTKIKLQETENKLSELLLQEVELNRSKNEQIKLNENMKVEIDNKQQHVAKLQSEIELLGYAHEDLKQRSDAIIENKNRENVELVSTIKKHEETIKKYQLEAEIMQNKMTGLRLTKKDQAKKIILLETTAENDRAERESILQMKDNDLKLEQDTIKTMHDKYLTLQNEYDSLESNWKSQKLQLESLRHTIEQMEMKKEVKVQLFTQNRAGLVCAVEEELMTTLKRKINSQSTDLRCLQCVSAAEIQPEIPLLLLCVTASRLGTDAQTAIQGLYLNSKTVLVIFHHKDEHALPSQASERVLTGMEFKTLGGIIDMAFLKGRGLYECELNTKSMIRVSNFITEDPNKAKT